MGKIKNFIVEKMIKLKLTSKEIDFMLFIFPLQDNEGNVYGLYYKNLCKRMHMSYQGFYNVMKSLEKKGMIKCNKGNYFDHDIKILENTFRNHAERSEGYVPANYNLFYEEEFYKLKAGAKLLALYLLKICGAGKKGYHEISTEKFYAEYPKKFGDVSERVMRTYLMQLKPFFSIGIKNGKYYMRPRVEIFKRDRVQRESFTEHTVDSIYRRNRVSKVNPTEIKEVGSLIWQYEGVAAKFGKNLTDVTEALRTAAEKCIEIKNEGLGKIKKRILDVKLIHTLLRTELKIPVEGDLKKAEIKVPAPASGTRIAPSTKNNFNNFPQRQYDYDELEKFLLNNNITATE